MSKKEEITENTKYLHAPNTNSQQQKFDANSHLSVSRNWKRLFASSAAAAAASVTQHQQQTTETEQQQQQQRPTAIVGGIVSGGQRRAAVEESVHHQNSDIDARMMDLQRRDADDDELTFVRAMAIPHCAHTDWDALREFRLRELNEFRQRASHMENTMRWWLTSAEQWRQKWLAVKGERNRLREENLRLRTELAITKTEMRRTKREEQLNSKCIQQKKSDNVEQAFPLLDDEDAFDGRTMDDNKGEAQAQMETAELAVRAKAHVQMVRNNNNSGSTKSADDGDDDDELEEVDEEEEEEEEEDDAEEEEEGEGLIGGEGNEDEIARRKGQKRRQRKSRSSV